MLEVLKPIAFAALAWWFSTGAILWLIGRSRATYYATALGATIMLAGATIALLALREATTVSAAYAGFATGLALWAWHEVMFLLGFVTGPRRGPCPPDLAPWPRFVVSTQTVIHHELAIAAHALLIAMMSWGADNQFAAWTFFLLWGMRLSAKLVVFLGAPNISDDFLPPHLDYLKTYFGKRAAAPAFPILVTLVSTATALIAYAAIRQPAGSYEAVGFILLFTLAALAVFEHWALVLRLPDSVLWSWASRRSPQAGVDGAPSKGGIDGL
ncbi:MAG: putative photosynthetic complex assembly protein PuhE [Pseudomonadota bacterium]